MIPQPRALQDIPMAQVLHAFPDPVWLSSVDGAQFLYNQRLLEAFPQAQLPPEEQQKMMHPAEREQLIAEFQHGLAAGQPFTLTYRLRHGEGYQWYQSTITPVLEQQQVTAWLGVVKAMQDTPRYLEALMDNAPIGLTFLTPEYRMQWVNQHVVQDTRYSRQEYLSKTLQELFPRTFQEVQPLIDQVMATGEALSPIEFEGRHAPEGRAAPYWRITYFPVKDPAGRMYGVGSLSEDITQRHRAETELRNHQDFLRRVTEGVPAIITLRDLQASQDIFSNHYVAEILGYTTEELARMSTEQTLALFPAEDLPRIYEIAERIRHLTEGETITEEYQLKHKDGSWRWIYGKTTIFSRDEQGKPLVSLNASVDITERKQIEMRLAESEAQLQQLVESHKRFVADASHEIKTPLAGIQGNLEVLLRYRDIPEEEKWEILQDCHREASRLGRLVTDLLSMARETRGLLMLEDEVRLEGLLQETLKAFQHTRGNRSLDFGHLDPCMVLGDTDRLKQLLVILVGNALKYTPDGGQVTLSLHQQPAHAELRIVDTGIGIPSESLEKVFERYYRADASGLGKDPGGSGLGLSIAKWIVEQHGGKIWLESEVGKGTTAIVQLPLTTA